MIHQDAPDRYRVTQTLQTMPYSRNVGLDPTTHRLYLAGAKFGTPPGGATARGRPPMVAGSFVVLVVERK